MTISETRTCIAYQKSCKSIGWHFSLVVCATFLTAQSTIVPLQLSFLVNYSSDPLSSPPPSLALRFLHRIWCCHATHPSHAPNIFPFPHFFILCSLYCAQITATEHGVYLSSAGFGRARPPNAFRCKSSHKFFKSFLIVSKYKCNIFATTKIAQL